MSPLRNLFTLAAWVSATALLAQPAVKAELDVQYGEVNGQKLLLDVYRTEAEGKRPAIVLVHGGGWVAGHKRSMRPMSETFARSGYVCFSVGYRLVKSDRDKFPAQIDDVQRAVRWIRKNADAYGIDPERIGAAGPSAGGHLVALLGTRDTRDNSDPELAKYSSKVQAVVDLFGPADLDPKTNSNLGPGWTAALRGLIGKSLDESPESYRDASPVTHVSKDDAPFLIFHGDQDKLVPLDQSKSLENALKGVGVEVTLVVFADEGHGFRTPGNNLKMLEQSIQFFDKHLKK